MYGLREYDLSKNSKNGQKRFRSDYKIQNMGNGLGVEVYLSAGWIKDTKIYWDVNFDTFTIHDLSLT